MNSVWLLLNVDDGKLSFNKSLYRRHHGVLLSVMLAKITSALMPQTPARKKSFLIVSFVLTLKGHTCSFPLLSHAKSNKTWWKTQIKLLCNVLLNKKEHSDTILYRMIYILNITLRSIVNAVGKGSFRFFYCLNTRNTNRFPRKFKGSVIECVS